MPQTNILTTTKINLETG